MKPKASVFIATSLDGFIARKDGGLDWLPKPGENSRGQDPGNEEDYNYNAFIRSIDAIVMGRKTFEAVQNFDPWPYGKIPMFVLSSHQVDIPDKLSKTVKSMKVSSPSEVIDELGARGYRHVYIDGGKTIQAFLRDGLIGDLIITRVPVLIGEGIPLFGPLERDIELKHLGTEEYPDGLVQSKYVVSKV